MDFKIEQIILWPKKKENRLRTIKFSCRGVEVISGWSQRGKSALIHIVDYCLGSGKCAIPIGRVREAVEWFGLVLVFPDAKRVLIARRNPEDQSSSSEMMWSEGRMIKIPLEPSRTDSRESVIERLNQLANLPSHGGIDEDANGSFDGPPSFRDMAAFNFQPQHIIANPYTLFFKADTFVHREKLVRSVFPYVLGAVDSETLNAQAEMRKLELELRQKRDELVQYERAAEMWKGRLQNYFSLSQQYGLIDQEPVSEDSWPVETYVALLQTVPIKWKSDPQFAEVAGMSRKAAKEIAALQVEEQRLLREIGDAERKISKLERLQNASNGYLSALDTQSQRLQPALWLTEKMEDQKSCPFCGNPSPPRERLNRLAATARQIGEVSARAHASGEPLTTELRRLEDTIVDRKKYLARIEARIEDWEAKSRSLRESRSRRDAISGMVGHLEAALETIDAASSGGRLKKEVDQLVEQIGKVAKKVNPGLIRRKTDSALAAISDAIHFYANLLKIEHADQQWWLDDRNLTLSTKGKGKTDFLWEIGSAANWMGYHVATLLALHEHFRSVAHNPVPKFLIIDQPSQAFFPEGIRAAKKIKGHAKVSDDLNRLRRLFKALSTAITRTKGGLQIILLEHAEPETWRGIQNFSMPKGEGEWREDNALIPFDWT